MQIRIVASVLLLLLLCTTASAQNKASDKLYLAKDIPDLNRDAFEHVDKDVDEKLSEKEYRSYVHFNERIRKDRALIPLGTRSYLDLEYVNQGHERQRLDLYLPKDATERQPLPLVIWVHGGGWQKGTKQEIGLQTFLLGHGFAVASVNYRLSRHASFPAQIHDCKAAVRFLRKNAKRFGLDSDNFGIWGPSAGGHLVSLLGTSAGNKSLEGSLGEVGVSSSVQAVCNWFGVTDFIAMNEAIKTEPNRVKPVTLLLGGTVEGNMDVARWASPVTHITPETPPFLIMHGTADKIVPTEQSQLFYDALRENGVNAKCLLIPDWKHTQFTNQRELDEVVDFFSKWLKRSE